RARALLAEAGQKDLHLSLKTSNNEFSRLQASVIQQNLHAVGITLDVRTYEFATMYADVLKGNFQLFTLQWVGGAVADPDILRRVFHSAQVPPNGFNRGFFSDPRVDRLLDAAAGAVDDESRRARYADVQRLVAEEAPYISLWCKTNVAVARRSLTGIHIPPIADFTFLKDVARTSPDRRVAR
ncbi:MAG TPA: ABC transporter substrate-binding protein, partial [Vicinamibacterales bacterium]|nr:ABC transporter substrate-binding protein [Vicinamibacterales bacterium]